ncbi:MAG: phenylalanine--tRNA ligase subunit alpha, partial [Candidatus Shapirobacteria bacterium]
MNQNLEAIKNEYISKIANLKNDQELESLRIELFGRNGLINNLFSKIKDIPNEEKKQYGANLNQLKTELEQLLSNKKVEKSEKLTSEKLTSTIFGLPKIGHLHPLTQTERQLNEVFRKLGFSIYNSPEIVTDEYNFARLNVPQNHPARDMQDTIYIKEPEYLLRTQTSAIEAYLLAQKNKNLPIR